MNSSQKGPKAPKTPKATPLGKFCQGQEYIVVLQCPNGVPFYTIDEARLKETKLARTINGYAILYSDIKNLLESGSTDIFAVLVKPATAAHALRYEDITGRALKDSVNGALYRLSKLHQVFQTAVEKSINDATADPLAGYRTLEGFFQEDEEFQNTPVGTFTESINAHILKLALFCLSVNGRIVGVNETGGFILSPTTELEVAEVLDYESFASTLNQNDLLSHPFFVIMDMTKLCTAADWMENPQEESEKNSASLNDEG